MADKMKPFTTVFRVADAPKHTSRKVTKRNRVPVSCSSCRARKQKCDRQVPCSGCRRRGEPEACCFQTTPATPGPSSSSGDSPPTTTRNTAHTSSIQSKPLQKEAKTRLSRLEKMVNQLMQSRTSPPADNSPSHHPKENQVRDLVGAEGFIGPTHWAAVLEGIRDFKEFLEAEDDSPPVPAPDLNAEPDLIFTQGTEKITMVQVLAGMPPQRDCDRLVRVYLSSSAFVPPFIHAKAFQRAYEAFWECPEKASFLWVSMLCSILHVGLRLEEFTTGGTSRMSPLAVRLRFLAARCLSAGDYLRARPWAVEALLCSAYTRLVQSPDGDPMIWCEHPQVSLWIDMY